MTFEGVYRKIAAAVPDDGVIVEVGVAFGRSTTFMARQLIDLKKHSVRFFAVDPWCTGGAIPEPSFGPWPFTTALGMMMRYAREELERVSLLRCTSVEAARMFADGSVFAVFIDADHTYDAVKADLLAWKDKAVGVFAGHDIDLDEANAWRSFEGKPGGVRKAVDEVLGPDGYVVVPPDSGTISPCWVRK